MADVRGTTRRASTRDSAVMISSVRPSLKYSFSGSGLRFAKGSTTTERSVCRVGAAPTTGAVAPERSAATTCPPLSIRWSTALAIIPSSRRETASDTSARSDDTGGGVCTNRRAMVA